MKTKIQIILMCMTTEEIIALAKSNKVHDIVDSGIENYDLFAHWVIENRKYPAHELNNYPCLFNLN